MTKEKINNKTKDTMETSNDFRRRNQRRRYSSFPPEDDYCNIDRAKTPIVNYSIPCVEKPQKESSTYRSISASTLAALIRNLSRFRKMIIVDCRYPFEYFGGHIKGAINIYTFSELEKYFYDTGGIRSTLEGLLPVFYCEFSQMRGPTMAKGLRNIDIKKHNQQLMNIDFPEIYLLDRGYKTFWADEKNRDLCEPSAYISMHSQPYRHILRQYDQHRRSKSVCNEKMRRRRINLNVFSETQIVVNEADCHFEEDRITKTPRTRLSFE